MTVLSVIMYSIKFYSTNKLDRSKLRPIKTTHFHFIQ